MSYIGCCFLFVFVVVFVLLCVVGSVYVVDSVVGQFVEWSGDSMVSWQMILCEFGFC